MQSEQLKSLQDWAIEYYQGSQEYATRLKNKWTPEWLATFSNYVKTIHEFADTESIVLDVGCGGGQTTYLISTQVKQVIGVDLSLAALNNRPSQPINISFQEADAVNLPFKDRSFDAVVSYATIEHLPNVSQALEEAIRVLKPGGYLILFAPNMISPIRLVSLVLKGWQLKRWHPDASPRFWLQALWLNFIKFLGFHHQFIYRQPLVKDLSFPGSDWDAICLVNPFDLSTFLQQHHFKIVRTAQGSTRLGKFVAQWFPLFAHGIGIVAQKP